MPKNQSLQSSYQKWVQSQFKTKEIADPYVINDYFKRLISPSIRTVDGQKKTAYFVMDYLQGEGGELGGKFFSPYSSSRLCFDLYSWLGSEVFCNQGYEITFEKYLPRLCLGRSNPYPNMDVMIRRGETLLFIESKFTETINYPIKNKVSQNNFGLPLSYSADLAKDLSCEDLKILEKYYYGSSEAAKRFREFFLKMDLLVKGTGLEGSDWFDLKQECTHLFGIFFYLLGSDPAHSVLTDFKGEIRQVLFYNIAYGFDFQKSEIAKKFLSEGNALIKGLVSSSILPSGSRTPDSK
jgi:hypothetical protein